MKKVCYIIPGFGESVFRQRDYPRIAKLLEKRGITPIGVHIDWHKRKPRRFSDYALQFLDQYKKPKGAKVYVLGFSFGAVTALLTARRAKPDALILCSLSPFFVEDQKIMKPYWFRWWKKEFEKSDYSFNKTARGVKTKTHLIIGTKELKVVQERARDAQRKIKNSKLVIAKGAKHRVGQKQYLIALECVTKML